MKHTLFTAVVAASLLSSAALAKDDCTDPVADWQPREQLRRVLIASGWEIVSLKVDDGCYEVRGLDRNGHRIEAKFAPASLKIVELEVKFDQSGDASDYLAPGGWAVSARVE